jgi:hypothetical protein
MWSRSHLRYPVPAASLRPRACHNDLALWSYGALKWIIYQAYFLSQNRVFPSSVLHMCDFDSCWLGLGYIFNIKTWGKPQWSTNAHMHVYSFTKLSASYFFRLILHRRKLKIRSVPRRQDLPFEVCLQINEEAEPWRNIGSTGHLWGYQTMGELSLFATASAYGSSP